jgi:predicted GNAT superfamily acetyltransferase
VSSLRPITANDHAPVLAWNAANVEVLSPLDEDELVELLGCSESGSVIVHQGRDVGFVITVATEAAYESENYRWFADRHDRFVYLDRIVIDASARRTGLATRVYEELEADAAQRVPVFCLEVNVEPPNGPSLAFHAARGYVEVGRHVANGHVVALFEKDLTASY